MEITIMIVNKISIKSHDAGHSKTQPQQLPKNKSIPSLDKAWEECLLTAYSQPDQMYRIQWLHALRLLKIETHIAVNSVQGRCCYSLLSNQLLREDSWCMHARCWSPAMIEQNMIVSICWVTSSINNTGREIIIIAKPVTHLTQWTRHNSIVGPHNMFENY